MNKGETKSRSEIESTHFTAVTQNVFMFSIERKANEVIKTNLFCSKKQTAKNY